MPTFFKCLLTLGLIGGLAWLGSKWLQPPPSLPPEPALEPGQDRPLSVPPPPAEAPPAKDTEPETSAPDPASAARKPLAWQDPKDGRFLRLADGRSVYQETVGRSEELIAATDAKAAALPPSRDLEVVETLFGAYLWAFKELPEGGENHEIVAGLTGNNPKKVVFLPADHPRLDPHGNLLDRWGTPYHFHKASGQEIAVISAGPDRRLWSADDVKTDSLP